MNNIIALNLSFVRPFILRWRFSLKTLWILSFLVVAFLLIFFVFQISDKTKASFLMANYEKQLTELGQLSKNLETNVSYLNSLANLENLLINLNYEKVSKVHFIRVPGTTVVAK